MWGRLRCREIASLVYICCWTFVEGRIHFPVNATSGARFLNEHGVEMVKVIVGLQDRDDEPSFEYRGKRFRSSFQLTKAVTMTIPADEMEAVKERADVKYVEEDSPVYAMSEIIPYGITTVQGDSPRVPPADTSASGCIRVCIVDSGVKLSHPDMPFQLNSPFVDGALFEVPASEPWHDPRGNNHGTHVAGTICARGHNNIGVRGVVSRPQKVCLSVARVFGDNSGETSTSAVNNAIEWCVQRGSHVINMSLGTGSDHRSTRDIVARVEAQQQKTLIVAAAGNGGDKKYFYPASYNGVVSVAALTQDNFRASFSQMNDQVTLAAPGNDVLSLDIAPGGRLLDANGKEISSSMMTNSVIPNPNSRISGVPFDCGLGDERCEGADGRVCVIERGGNTFAEKAENCEKEGGVGVVVYNNEPGGFSGTLGNKKIDIPVVGVAQNLGPVALQAARLVFERSSGSYVRSSGTSMACPHVAGGIAKLWAALPGCNKHQIRTAITATAKDLGKNGRDDEYGHGLLQIANAYDYLVNLPPPCGNPQAANAQPTDKPTRAPTHRPTNRPTRTPVDDGGEDFYTPPLNNNGGKKKIIGGRIRGSTRHLRGENDRRRTGDIPALPHTNTTVAAIA